jgi:hypothetical protein
VQIPRIFQGHITATKTRNIQTYFNILFQLGCVLHTIDIDDGDYPQIMEKCIATKSKEEGYSRSRLPSFTKKEMGMSSAESNFRCGKQKEICYRKVNLKLNTENTRCYINTINLTSIRDILRRPQKCIQPQ